MQYNYIAGNIIVISICIEAVIEIDRSLRVGKADLRRKNTAIKGIYSQAFLFFIKKYKNKRNYEQPGCY